MIWGSASRDEVNKVLLGSRMKEMSGNEVTVGQVLRRKVQAGMRPGD